MKKIYIVVSIVVFLAVVGIALATSAPRTMALPYNPALTDNLVSYWKLDEHSGTRYDSHGSYDLTAFGVGWDAGKLGDSAVLTGTSYLSAGDQADFRRGAGVTLTIAGWVYITDTLYVLPVAVKGYLEVSPEYALFYDAGIMGSGFTAIGCAEGGICNVANVPDSIFTNTWYYVVGTFSQSSVCISINAGDFLCNSNRDISRLSYASELYLGGDGSTNARGREDSVGFWRAGLTDSDVDDLYNGGAGKEYPFRRVNTNPNIHVNCHLNFYPNSVSFTDVDATCDLNINPGAWGGQYLP